MKSINKAAIPLAAIALIATGALSTYAFQSQAQTATNTAIAQTSREGKADHMANLVKAITEKFGLNQAEVQQVFEEHHTQMQQQHQADEATRLSQAVTDGKLTQDQADKITAKRAELQAQRESDKTKFESMSDSERQAAMKAKMDELKQWATDNNIPAGYLPFGGGRGGHGGPGGMHKGMGGMMK